MRGFAVVDGGGGCELCDGERVCGFRDECCDDGGFEPCEEGGVGVTGG